MKKVIFWFFVLSVFLVFSWFRNGLTIAGGEESFSIFNSTLIIAQTSLWQLSGTGYPLPFYSTRLLPVLFNVVLTQLGMPSFLIQAVFYFFILLSGFTGTFLLTRFLFKKENNLDKISFLAALFYVFNLYALSQIFNRFLYSGMFLWAYLPIFLFLWLKWLEEGTRKYFLIFLATSLLYSLTYLQPAHLITLWSSAAVCFLIVVIKKHIQRRKATILALLGFLFWVIINVWWLYPYAKLSDLSVTEISSWQSNFDSLRGVSQYFPTNQILLLRQNFLFGKDSFWYSFYSQPWVYVISIGVLLIAILGLITSRKEKNWLYLAVLAFIGWFVSKGTNPPLGYSFFKFLFSNFPFTAALRNPYEKFGLVWLLPYSIFFALGVGWIYKRLKPKIREIVVGIVLILSCGVLVWPMWTGDLYKSARVRVPDYYEQANQFLNQDKTDGRVLMLPIIPGDGVRYFWGYQGVEPSEFLFDKPSISKILRTKYADEKYMRLYDAFVNDKSYNQLLDEMNIKYLVLHNDLDTEISGASSSTQTKIILDKNPEISLIERIGELEIYEFKGNKDGSLFEVRGEDPPVLSYEKLSPARYRVQIGNARPRFDLIFKSTFNELWETKIDGKKLDEHFLVYDYANAWRIDRIGDYNIDIVFKVWPWE